MAITKFTGTTSSIQDLPDRPNQTGGFTPANLKIRFDQFAIDSKKWFNENLTAEVDAGLLEANTNASNAVNTANSSSSVANSADTKATNAVSTASTASNNASTALSTANISSTIATNANTKATNVETDYNTVKPQLLQAVSDVALKVNKTYVDEVALNYQNGLMLDNSITNNKMANNMKRGIVGGLALYDDLASQLADMTYQLATGTATALIVAMATLTSGYAKNFIASADNGGVATTINSKPIYKPGTILPPTLKKDKPYTVIYNLAGNCFFLKASATGKATPPQVLAGVEFSSEEDTELIGIIPNVSGVNTLGTQAGVGTPGIIYIKPPLSYNDGSGSSYVWENNFSALNIVKDINMFGVIGTAIPLIINASEQIQFSDYSPFLLTATFSRATKIFTCQKTGSYRFKYRKNMGDSGDIVQTQIYKNGSPFGALLTLKWESPYVMQLSYSDDYNLNVGDTICLYGSSNAVSAHGTIDLVSLCYSPSYGGTFN